MCLGVHELAGPGGVAEADGTADVLAVDGSDEAAEELVGV